MKESTQVFLTVTLTHCWFICPPCVPGFFERGAKTWVLQVERVEWCTIAGKIWKGRSISWKNIFWPILETSIFGVGQRGAKLFKVPSPFFFLVIVQSRARGVLWRVLSSTSVENALHSQFVGVCVPCDFIAGRVAGLGEHQALRSLILLFFCILDLISWTNTLTTHPRRAFKF